MKKLLTSLILACSIVAGFLFVPATAYAVDVISPVCTGDNAIDSTALVCQRDPNAVNDNPLYGPRGVLTTAINIISLIVAIVSVIVIIIAGIKFITSQGNAQTITTARNQIIYSFIGLAVALLAQGLVAFVLKKV